MDNIKNPNLIDTLDLSGSEKATLRLVLDEQIDQRSHNLMCYSNNLLMNEPKDGFEKEWAINNNAARALEKLRNKLFNNVVVTAMDNKYSFEKGV